MFSVNYGSISHRWLVESTNHRGVTRRRNFDSFTEAHNWAIAWARS